MLLALLTQLMDRKQGRMDEGRNFQTIQTFFEGQGSNLVGGHGRIAMRVKASALFERAHQLSMNWDHREHDQSPVMASWLTIASQA